MIKGTFTSVWQNGRLRIKVYAELDEETGEVFAESAESVEESGILIKEYFTDEDGNKHTVCPTCNCFIMRDKMFEGEGNGNDYDGQKICSYPYCESNLSMVTREKTIRYEIVEAMKNWLDDADSETLVRVFNSEFEGNLTYDVVMKKYAIDSDSAKNLNLTTY